MLQAFQRSSPPVIQEARQMDLFKEPQMCGLCCKITTAMTVVAVLECMMIAINLCLSVMELLSGVYYGFIALAVLSAAAYCVSLLFDAIRHERANQMYPYLVWKALSVCFEVGGLVVIAVMVGPKMNEESTFFTGILAAVLIYMTFDSIFFCIGVTCQRYFRLKAMLSSIPAISIHVSPSRITVAPPCYDDVAAIPPSYEDVIRLQSIYVYKEPQKAELPA